MKKFLFLLTIFLFVSVAFGREQLKVDGYLSGYKWAHSSNKLAILFSNEDSQSFIHIFNAETNQCTDKIVIPEKYNVKSFDWLSDDSGFLFSASIQDDSTNESLIDCFYIYRFSDKSIKESYKNIEVIYSQITDIAVSNTLYWAVTYIGEGHPDVAIYNDTTMVLSTDVYPNFIYTLIWQDNNLYCGTGAYLEFGLTREEREKHPKYKNKFYEGRNNAVIYKIDPLTKKAELAKKISVYKLLNTSFDKKYYINIKKESKSFAITFIKL